MEYPTPPSIDTPEPLSDEKRDELSLSQEDKSYIDRIDTTVSYEVKLRRLIDENQDIASFLTDWVQKSKTHRHIYRLLVFRQSGLLLRDINNIAHCNKRTVRRRINELEDAGIVVGYGKPKVISIKSKEIYVLMVDLTRLLD